MLRLLDLIRALAYCPYLYVVCMFTKIGMILRYTFRPAGAYPVAGMTFLYTFRPAGADIWGIQNYFSHIAFVWKTFRKTKILYG